jgi:hypothetical protein
LFDQHRHMSRQWVGRVRKLDAQPIAYFLADRGANNALDLNIVPNGWTGHERLPVGVAAVDTDRPGLDSRAIILRA